MTEMTHTIAGREVHIIPAPSFGRRDANRPTRWVFDLPGALLDDEDLPRPRATVEEALADARAFLGQDTIPTCSMCRRSATRTASLGPACDTHYDDLAG